MKLTYWIEPTEGCDICTPPPLAERTDEFGLLTETGRIDVLLPGESPRPGWVRISRALAEKHYGRQRIEELRFEACPALRDWMCGTLP